MSRKKYHGKFIGYYTDRQVIILYNTHDTDDNYIGEVYIPKHQAPDLAGKLVCGDKIEFYCDEIQDKLVISAVDVRIIETRQLKK